MDIKDKVQTTQSLIGILAILVGAWWTYDNFINERKHFPHGNIEQTTSHIPLSPDINLLRVTLKATNSGTFKMEIVKSIERIQQILPILCPGNHAVCAKDQVDLAIQKTVRQEDRFVWPMIAMRESLYKSPLDVEPGETENMDFEFAINSEVSAIRVSSYIRNESKVHGNKESGWHMSSFYNLTSQRIEHD